MVSTSGPKNIVYLFGAGSTHAERLLECRIQKTGYDKKTGELSVGLTAERVSEGVISLLLKKDPDLLNRYGIDEASMNPPTGRRKVDVELFISMLETLRTNQSEKDASVLRKYFYSEINKRLFVDRTKLTPRLHAALVEWHKINSLSEKLTACLTVNYDSMYEESCDLVKSHFDYGFNAKTLNTHYKKGESYLLKLHGSFDWQLDSEAPMVAVSKAVPADSMLWIPPKLNKEYLGYPYNIIHGRAEEALRGCDILRVVGCSLSQNDLGLISLLFKTQKTGEKNKYVIEYIGSESGRNQLDERLGMLLSVDESFYQKADYLRLGKDPTNNYFLDWLYYLTANSKKSKAGTKYLKNVKKWTSLS